MIDAALGLLAGQLNQHLRRSFQADEDLAVLSDLQEADGSAVPSTANRLVIFLAGVERDTTVQSSVEPGLGGGGSSLRGYPPVHLNLLVMCAANFSGASYPEALKFLSAVVGFMQGRPVMDHSNTPDMHPGLERLVFSIEEMGANDLHSLWGIHGNRYLPSVLYRVRLVTLESGQIFERQTGISGAETGVRA